MLVVDSREKWTHSDSNDTHISGWLERKGIPWTVKKLDVGDYMMAGGTLTIDRKQNIEEISKNLTNPADKKRFWNEVRLAYHRHLRLVVLIESQKYRSLMDLRGWKSAYSPVNGVALVRQMERLNRCYGVQFEFCQKRSTARRIIEILTKNLEEELLNV